MKYFLSVFYNVPPYFSSIYFAPYILTYLFLYPPYLELYFMPPYNFAHVFLLITQHIINVDALFNMSSFELFHSYMLDNVVPNVPHFASSCFVPNIV